MEEHGHPNDNIPVWLVVHGHHGVALNDTVLLGEIALGERLATVSVLRSSQKLFTGTAYVLVMLLSDLLAGKLLEPLLSLVAAVRLQTWNDERHLVKAVELKCLMVREDIW